MYAEKPHILVLDDDDRIRDLLARYLTGEGAVVVTASRAEEVPDLISRLQFDMLVFDVMLPGQTGVDLTRSLRAAGCDLPILLLTAMGEADDRINGLEAGADDYLVKPFEPRELQLRINAILRRRPEMSTSPSRFSLGEWLVDLEAGELSANGNQTVQKLTPVELRLMRALSSKPGAIMPRDELATLCGVDPDERTIDVQITRLRRKLGDESKDARYILTVRGQGYQLNLDSFSVV